MTTRISPVSVFAFLDRPIRTALAENKLGVPRLRPGLLSAVPVRQAQGRPFGTGSEAPLIADFCGECCIDHHGMTQSVPQGRLKVAQDVSPGCTFSPRPVPSGTAEIFGGRIPPKALTANKIDATNSRLYPAQKNHDRFAPDRTRRSATGQRSHTAQTWSGPTDIPGVCAG